ncbi:unnamed protein product [Linum tenue]|uniref:Protein EARLY FLOWERING 3 n=1 Tax=Linum tenue TaxID=586396 RepID=A0AAV0JGR4_9ROSI|nr:unnamed protein product [Linum tenue]
MKRGKDDEKMMGPLFPRLHVNDTEKGGPRAPPRNKMALYEQLSIPSQRFNSGVLPRNPSNLAPAGSSSQASGLERTLSSPPTLADQLPSFQPSAGNLNSSLAPREQRKKAGDEDDFTVPVFVHTGASKLQRKRSNVEELAPFSSMHSCHSNKAQNTGYIDTQCASSIDPHSRHGGNPCISSDNLHTRENFAESGEEAIVHPKKRSHGNQQQPAWLQSNVCALGDAVPEMRRRGTEKNDVLVRKDSLGSCEEPCTPNEGSGTCVTKVDVSIPVRNTDKGDDASDTSIVDSAEPLDISPDDVVDMIGQKHFWKARRAIVNQQRVFAVQVFELHRLIKVQQLIAGAPHLLVEESNFLTKSSIPGSPMKKLQAEYVLLQPARGTKRKDDSQEPSHNKMEGSAENAVGKSLGNHSQPPTTYRPPHVGNQVPVPAITDSNNTTSSWNFHQATGQHWLVPVMSPTEGLVYKPYAPPGQMGPGCGGYGAYGPPPVMGNFMNPGYGLPTYFQQGMGCFPPYGMSVMSSALSGSAVDQSNCFPGSGSHGQISQFSGSGANFNVQHNVEVLTQKSGAVSVAEIRVTSKEAELQRSTASSISERVEVVGSIQQRGDIRDDASLQLFPRAPSAFGAAPQRSGNVSRVIRVVPHNSRSATESAARIFQSIQEERKQNESV